MLADGGKLQLSARQGNYEIAIFTEPNPLRAGPVDVSVLLLDANSGAPVADANVTIAASRVDAPDVVLTQPATVAAATNKLFRAAIFDLPTAGSWRIKATVSGPLGNGEATFDADVAEKLPRALALWPWLVWPIIPIGLFACYELTKRRRKVASNRLES